MQFLQFHQKLLILLFSMAILSMADAYAAKKHVPASESEMRGLQVLEDIQNSIASFS